MLSDDEAKRIAGVHRAVGSAQESMSAAFIERYRQDLTTIGTMAASQIQDAIRSRLPTGDVFAKALEPRLQGLAENAMASVHSALRLDNIFTKIIESERRRNAEMVDRFRSLFEATLPPNWRGGGIDLPDNLETLVLEEGLPLAWVPPKDVLVRVIKANDAGARRKVIGGSWKKIAKACFAELDATSAKELVEYVEFARLAAEALLAGHHQASQALSANTLDTMIRTEFDGKSRRVMTLRKTRLDIEEYPLRLSLVLGGIWGAHAEFWP